MLSIGGSSVSIEPNPKSVQKPVTKVALKSRYFTTAEASIPHLKHRQIVHNPVPLTLPANTLTNLQNQALNYIIQKDNYLTNQNNKKQSKSLSSSVTTPKVLDGFYILDAASVTMPEEVLQLTICNKSLTSLVEDELTYFTEVLYIDASENSLPFKGFGAFPKLCELRLACNNIKNIPELPYGFNNLLYLDLSYNKLTIESICSLYDVPFLKELDLSGNNLTTLPKNMSSFPALEKFILAFNKFEDNDVLISLSSISSLRFLDVSNNFFSNIPHSCLDYNGWKLLETLNLSFNYFASEESVDIITRLPRLVQLMLYGNPLLGPTGEDPMFIYIENLMETAFYVRDHSNTSLPDLEFITEVPRKRVLKKGQPLGRLALYRDFAMVQLEKADEIKSNREWKRQGALTLFTEAMNNSIPSSAPATQPPASAPSPSFPDMTFLTNSIAAGNFSAINNKEVGSGSTFYGIEKNDVLANELMEQVADEMGLVNNEDFELFEQYTKLPPSVIEQELMKSIENNTSKISELESLSMPNFANSQLMNLSTNSSPTSNKKNPTDHLPLSLFKDDPDDSLDQFKNKANPTTFISQPISLKTAMKSLQRAIQNPLTDYYNVPLKHEKKNEKIYEKTTETSKLRQLNRIPLPPLIQHQEKTEKTLLKEQRGLPEAPMLARMRQENRERTMLQLDLVLEDLAQHTDKIVSYDKKNSSKKVNERRRSGKRVRTIESEYEKSLKSSQQNLIEENEEDILEETEDNQADNSNHQSLADVKQSMSRMRDFARPEKGVKTLMSMVKNIVSEFNDDD